MASSSNVLRVGVYDNPPKIMVDEQGRPSGIMGDLLSTIAEQEGWQLQPVACTWDQCLEWLEQGKIDVMPDVALTEPRAKRFSFHETPALLSWSQIYEAPGTRLTSLLDLNGKRLAVLSGSVQQEYLRELANNFNLKIHWVEVTTLEQGFDAVAHRRADALATNHFIGDIKAQAFDLTPSPILFQPAKLFFATPQHQLAGVRNTIDAYLDRWQANTDTPYFQILRQWGLNTRQEKVPASVWWAIGGLVTALLLMLLFSQLLRRQVAEKTRSLREGEARLNSILDSVEACIYIKGRDLRYQYVNRNTCERLGLPPQDIIGRTDDAFFDPETVSMLRAHDRRVIENAERVAEEESSKPNNAQEKRSYLSVKLPLLNTDKQVYALCGISTDITEYRRIQDQLHQLAFYDPLTGLPNRRLLLDRLHMAQANHGRSGEDGAVLVIDLDNFAALNDTLGHDMGDQLLVKVAKRLQMGQRRGDIAGRLSSDEFIVILQNLGRTREHTLLLARLLARELQEKLAQPYQLDLLHHVITTSIGVALMSDAAESTSALLKTADLALNAAKSAGRNSLRFFEPGMQAEFNRRSQLESALRTAIRAGSLQLYVQPQLDSRASITGMEALLRWFDPELGPVSPADFIPVAESSGLIIPLGDWVLQSACAILAHWSRIPVMQHLTLAVNISPDQFRHKHFVRHVEECIAREQINPERLKLEITESLLIGDLEDISERMLTLNQRGIRFSLDDFGTGYASLGYLKRLPLHQLKIDRSFVSDLLINTNDEAIVRTIIALGRSLGLDVIAEGTETAEQVQRLRELGCESFQGYLYGKPAPPDVWQARLAASAMEG